MSEAFEKCMKRAFAEIGVAPQYDTPAWRACKHTWDAAYTAGLLRAAEVVEYNAGEYATEVAGMIRKEAGE